MTAAGLACSFPWPVTLIFGDVEDRENAEDFVPEKVGDVEMLPHVPSQGRWLAVCPSCRAICASNFSRSSGQVKSRWVILLGEVWGAGEARAEERMPSEGDTNARWHLGCPRSASAADGRRIARGDMPEVEKALFSCVLAGEAESGTALALKHLHSLTS